MFNFRPCRIALVVFYLFILIMPVFSQTVGWWHADEGSGNILGDSSGNDYDFDDVGAGTGSDYSWTTGYLDDGLVASIDSNSHLRTTIDPNKLCYQATVEAWIKPTALDSDGSAIVSLYNGFTLHFAASHEDLMRFVCYVNGTWKLASVSGGVNEVFFDDNWHHVAGVYDGIPKEGNAHVYLYWDGQLVATTEIATSSPLPIGYSNGTTGTTLCIGTNAWYYNDNPNVHQHYRGGIDEIKISDTAINFADANVVGMWHMDEGSGNYTYDSSVNCYDFNSIGTGNGSDFYWNAGYDINGLSTDDDTSYLVTSICPNDICYQATVQAWIKPAVIEEDKDSTQIISLLNGFALHFGADHEDLIRFIAYTNGTWQNVAVTSGTQAALIDGNWHHVAGVYDGIPDSNNHAHMYMYWDGILVASTEIDTNSPLPIGNSDGTTGSDLYIGANAWLPGYSQYYKGGIDEVSILNTIPENPDRFDSFLNQNKIDFENDFYSCKLSTSKNFFGLANLKFDSIDHNSPVDYLSDQNNTAFFKVLGENLYVDSNDFVVDDLTKDQQAWGNRWIISLSCPGRKLAAILTVDVNSSTDEMLWGLQVKNRSEYPRKLQVIFPVLGRFNINNNLTDNYYYYPWGSGLNGKIDCNMISEYGNLAWMQLVSVYDPNSNAGIYAYPEDDSGGFKGIVLKKLFSGTTPTVNNDSTFLPREKPNKADFNEPVDVLDDVNDGIAFAFYYPMKEIAAYHNFSYPQTVVRIYDGGWREALEDYSSWVHSWYTQLNTPQWYKRCFNFFGQWADEFYDDVNDTYITSQGLQGHEDVIEWVNWHDYNDVNTTPDRLLEAYQFGDYYYPQDRGGLTSMQDEIEACKNLGCEIMLYLSCRFCWTDTDTGLAYGQSWAAMFEPGSYTCNGPVTEKWVECQYEPNAWADYSADISGRIIGDTGAAALYIDEMPLLFPCYNPNHIHYQEDKFPCSADRMHQYINNLTSAVRAENSQAIVMGEYAGSDYLTQYFDGSWDQTYNGWSFTAPYYNENSLNYFRFYFPEFKLALLGGSDSDLDQRRFFNGIGIAGSSYGTIVSGSVLKENADAFSSLNLKPLIPTKVSMVLANEFSNDVNDKTVYTIYNKSSNDVNTAIMDVPHKSNYHYVELYYDTSSITAAQSGSNDTLSFAIDANEVLCIAQLQQIVQATRSGWVVDISLSETDANDHLVAFYNEDTSYEGFSNNGQTITLNNGIGQINILDTFGGWGKLILKLYRNNILFDEVIVPEQSPCPSGDVVLWHLEEGTGTDSNDSASGGGNNVLHLGSNYSWAAGCPNVPSSDYCLSSPNDCNSYCQSRIYPGDIAMQLTVDAWVKPTSVDDDSSAIISVANCFNLHFGHLRDEPNDLLRFICYASGTWPFVVAYDANNTFFDGNWHHIKAVYDGIRDSNGKINLYLYVDGTLAASSAITSSTSLPLGATGSGIGSFMYVGANAWLPAATTQHYKGAIDEIRLSNIAE